MLLNALVLVLRETLEAGVLVSLVYSLVRGHSFGGRALLGALVFASVGAIGLGSAMATLSAWWDYRGQEIIGALLQFAIYAALSYLGFVYAAQRAALPTRALVAAVVAVVLAVVREGAEVHLFLHGFAQTQEHADKLMFSGFIGLGLGVSVGALTYHSLQLLPPRGRLQTQLGLLVLIAAGMVAQAVQLLLQADMLPGGLPVWNTNAWVAETSITGQLLYAVFGYEAEPTLSEVLFYTLALLALPILLLIRNHCLTRRRYAA